MKKALIIDKNGAFCIKSAPKDLKCSWIAEQIECQWIEIVRPKNLPKGLVMIVDEEGHLKPNIINIIGSHLYGAEEHGETIVGDIMILREVFGDEGPELAPLCEEEAYELFCDLSSPIKYLDWYEKIEAAVDAARKER